jgi:hypothetical protein
MVQLWRNVIIAQKIYIVTRYKYRLIGEKMKYLNKGKKFYITESENFYAGRNLEITPKQKYVVLRWNEDNNTLNPCGRFPTIEAAMEKIQKVEGVFVRFLKEKFPTEAVDDTTKA